MKMNLVTIEEYCILFKTTKTELIPLLVDVADTGFLKFQDGTILSFNEDPILTQIDLHACNWAILCSNDININIITNNKGDIIGIINNSTFGNNDTFNTEAYTNHIYDLEISSQFKDIDQEDFLKVLQDGPFYQKVISVWFAFSEESKQMTENKVKQLDGKVCNSFSELSHRYT